MPCVIKEDSSPILIDMFLFVGMPRSKNSHVGGCPLITHGISIFRNLSLLHLNQ